MLGIKHRAHWENVWLLHYIPRLNFLNIIFHRGEVQNMLEKFGGMYWGDKEHCLYSNCIIGNVHQFTL